MFKNQTALYHAVTPQRSAEICAGIRTPVTHLGLTCVWCVCVWRLVHHVSRREQTHRRGLGERPWGKVSPGQCRWPWPERHGRDSPHPLPMRCGCKCHPTHTHTHTLGSPQRNRVERPRVFRTRGRCMHSTCGSEAQQCHSKQARSPVEVGGSRATGRLRLSRTACPSPVSYETVSFQCPSFQG